MSIKNKPIVLHKTNKSSTKKLKIAFINPPHADWSLTNTLTYHSCQSHYQRYGKYKDNVIWLPAPYKWNKYSSYEEVYEEIKDADIIMFSSYVWNYQICDGIAKIAKQHNKINLLGGPHIGVNEKEFLESRTFYDFICQTTKPGEVFMEDFINCWFEKESIDKNDISWELNSVKKTNYNIDCEYSIYEDHLNYLKEIVNYAKDNELEPFVVLETTRGCPYKCVFCEWGGGIGTKIYKKSIDIVKRDIDFMIEAGFRDAYLTDANFGIFEERDLEIFEYAWNKGFNLTDISTVKTKNLDRRKRLIDAWFNVVGTDHRKNSYHKDSKNMWEETRRISVVPTVSIQSISEEAMKVAERIDLNFKDKIELSKYINERCVEMGYPIPSLELILAMPGSTINDFYDEMEIIWNFKAWGSYRHDYMFLPDSHLSKKEYMNKHKIKTIEVFSDIVEENGVDNWNSLYQNKKNYFKTILSCYSFTEDEMKEMWFMNTAGNHLLKEIYPQFQNHMSPSKFTKLCYNVISNLQEFSPIKKEIDNIFDEKAPPKSIRQLFGKFRVDVIEEFLNENQLLIKNGVMLNDF